VWALDVEVVLEGRHHRTAGNGQDGPMSRVGIRGKMLPRPFEPP
jgi:hypothetical protein